MTEEPTPAAAPISVAPAPTPASPAPVRKKLTVREIDNALILYKGRRREAATYLGITLSQLKDKIFYHEYLQLRWSREAILANAKAAETKENDPSSIVERLLVEQAQLLEMHSQKILQQMKGLEKRIEMNDRAMAEPENKDLSKWLFTHNERGEPSEEIMVRDSYAKLLDEFRKAMETSQRAIWTKTKVQALLQKYGPQSTRSKPSLGMKPKGERVTQIVAQNAIVVR